MNYYVRHFSRDMLPMLGTNWHRFPTMDEAKAFAKWARRVTRNSQRPCSTYIEECNDNPDSGRFEVRVSNW